MISWSIDNLSGKHKYLALCFCDIMLIHACIYYNEDYEHCLELFEQGKEKDPVFPMDILKLIREGSEQLYLLNGKVEL